MAGLACLTASPGWAADAEPAFDVFEYDVEGNTRLDDDAIERAVSPYLGEQKSFRDVEAARLALEKAYHDAGYLTVVVTIPDQRVDDGNVVLKAVEGRIDRLRVKGAEYHLASSIKEGVPELAPGSIPHFPTMQSDLDVINRTADLKATPVLKAGRTPGTVDVTLDVDDQLPLHGNLELSNRHMPGVDPIRLSGTVRYDNLWQAGHSIGLSAQETVAAPEQYQVYSANYALPLNKAGDSLLAYGMHSRSDVPGTTSVLNNSDIVGLRWVMALPSAADYGHSANFGLDHKDVKAVQGVLNNSLVSTLQPAITYVPLVAAYNGVLTHESGTTSVDGTLTIGMRNLFGNNDSAFNAKRAGASAQFATLRAGLTETGTLQRWTLTGRIEGQLASGLLIANEQYAAGGVDTVRGYLESERTGDQALRLSLEARSPALQIQTATMPWRLNGLVFFDGARLVSLQYDPTTGGSLPSLTYMMRGAGVGLRLSGPKGLSFDMDVARAFDDGGTASTNTRSGDIRVHSRLVWEFL